MVGQRSLAFVLGFALVALSLGGTAGAATPVCTGTPLTAAYTCANLNGSVSISTLGSTYFQNFDTLANTGSGTALPTGWATQETGNGSAVNGIYTVGTGSGISGDTYSFGNATGNTERALGGLFSGSLKPILGAAFKNDTGTPATHIDIAYTGEHWRFGALGRVSDRLDFQYSLDASSLVTGTWTDVDALDFTSPTTPATTGPLNGNVAPNRTAISGTIVAVVPPGATLWIRWNDFDAAPGADDGLAVDDFSLVLRSQEVAPTVSSTSPAAGSEGAAVDTDLAVTFSEPVAVSGNWFDISCGTTGGHTATVTGGSQSYTLDPDANFAAGETCTATIYAANVTDLDRADPPDNMAANYTWVFTTIDNSVCGDQATRIHTVQGSGLASPIVGSKVTVEGVVIGDYQATGQLGGFYVQEEDADADGDPATSEGIFIFSTLRDVAVGDVVRVRGTVSEFFDLTELSSVDRIESCGTGASVTPATVTLPVPSMTYFERYEGVLVTFPQTLTATETFNLGRYGEVRLAEGGRLYVPSTQTVPTDAAAYNALEDANNRRSFILDDGNGQQNIDPTIHPVGGLSAPNTLRSGYTATGLTGVFDYRFSTYRLQPVGPVPFTAANPRTAAPDDVGGNLRVASFNVLNFFNGNGTHQESAAGGFPTSRGANTLTEFQRQVAKEVSALQAMNADVVGLMEIENDPENGELTAIADLVAALNNAMGAGTYAYVNTGKIGTDEIKVALIYKPGLVTPVGPWKIITTATDPRFLDTKNRPSLAQTFERNGTGERLAVVVNHLKSKGSGCDDVGDPDTGDGQGNCNGTREKAAMAIADWLATDPTGSGDPDFLLIGDMNAYTFEDPIAAFEAAGFRNMVRELQGLGAYSYVFNGESGYLDHALASGTLAGQITGAVDWHINADEPTVLDYNVEFKTADQVNTFYDSGPYRSSDHDPVVVGLYLDATPPTISVATTPAEPNDRGWFTQDVIVDFTCADNVALLSCTGDTTLGEGFDQSATGIATDKAGHTAGLTIGYINVDKTAPTITGAATTTPNGNGWYSANVTVQFTCADNLALATCTPDTDVATEGAGQSVTGTATDQAGHSATFTVTGLNVDKTKPVVRFSAHPATYTVDQTISITCTATDALSGIAAATCPSLSAAASSVGVGTHTLYATATDKAGNTTTTSTTFTVTASTVSLCTLTRQLVTDSGIATSLCAKLDAAAAAGARGNATARANQINAYVNEVNAQRGKAITDANATTLITIASGL